jgi:4-hydroxy-2-oxoheptanedioate aldolase
MMAIPAFTLARRLRAGETVFSGWCSLPYPIVAETLGREGFGTVTLEAQHGLWDMSALLTGVAAVRQGGAAPVVRVPVGDFAMVSRVLDFGAEGIIAPMINTAADARAFAAAAKYPPTGERSWGPHRATTLAGLTDQTVYLREANDHVITLAMIETRTALDNLDAIVDTPGIDGLFLGPSDLSIALSDGKTLDPLSKDVERALDRIVAAAQRAKKDCRRLLPFARARGRARRARDALPRGDERSGAVARRHGGGDEGAQGQLERVQEKWKPVFRPDAR